MALASTQPQSFATPNFDLASLIIHGTAANPTGDAIADLFDGEFKRGDDGGILYANYLGGPIGIYGALQSAQDRTETMSFSAGPDDAIDLASLLDSTRATDRHVHSADNSTTAVPYHVDYEFNSAAKTYVLNVFTDANALSTYAGKQPGHRKSRPSVDEHGGVDCAGAVNCQTDPRTGVTTVTYPDGVVALVQRVNDITLVAYKTMSSALLGRLEALRPPVSAPQPRPAPTSSPSLPGPAAAPSEDPPTGPDPTPPAPAAPAGPAAPSDVKTGPRLNVIRPAPDYSPRRTGSSAVSGAPHNLTAPAGTVTGLVTSVVDAVKSTVRRVLNPAGAAAGSSTGKGAVPAQDSQ